MTDAADDRLWVVLGTDHPDGDATRAAARPHHLAYWEEMRDAHGRTVLQMGGPMTDEPGTRMIGSMFIIRVPSRQEAEALLAKDPYVTQGVFKSYEIRPWRWLVGTPEKI